MALTTASYKKHRSSTRDVICFGDFPYSSPLTPCIPSTSTESQSSRSVPALISELWIKEAKGYEVRIQELEKEGERSASLLRVYQGEVQASKQGSANFEAQNVQLGAEIETLKARNAWLEKRLTATKKALEGIKRKFLANMIKAANEIMAGFDEIGAQ